MTGSFQASLFAPLAHASSLIVEPVFFLAHSKNFSEREMTNVHTNAFPNGQKTAWYTFLQ